MTFQAIPGQMIEILGADGSPLMNAIQARFCATPGMHRACITVFHKGNTSLVAFVPDEIYGEVQALMRQTWEESRAR